MPVELRYRRGSIEAMSEADKDRYANAVLKLLQGIREDQIHPPVRHVHWCSCGARWDEDA